MCCKFNCKFSCKLSCKFTYCFCAHMHEIVKYFILTEIRYKIDRRTLDPLKLIECGAGYCCTHAYPHILEPRLLGVELL